MNPDYFAAALVVAVPAYFAPVIAGAALRTEGRVLAAIVLVNFFFGWTLVGWVGCWVWVLLAPRSRDRGPASFAIYPCDLCGEKFTMPVGHSMKCPECPYGIVNRVSAPDETLENEPLAPGERAPNGGKHPLRIAYERKSER